jgi:aryl-alcohol dehydrogenase-like predicted oxidoreductase
MAVARSATPEGTRRYRDRMVDQGARPDHFREIHGLWVSSIGMGTYSGLTTDALDARYREAAVHAARHGCNFFDTAINYRHQRSERALGEALAEIEADGIAARDEIVIATKGGYIPFDGEMPRDPRGYFLTTFLEPGILGPDDVVAGMHCMSPRFLDDQIRRSLANLGLETIDLYYVQGPEGQIPAVGSEEFERRLRAAFEMLEVKVADGLIGAYGTATWDGYRVTREEPDHIDLPRLVDIAREVGGPEHAFRWVQAPINLAMPEALFRATQPAAGGTLVPLIEAARRARLALVGSAALLHGQLGSGLPPEIDEALPGLDADAQRALQFCRSSPGVAVALVGMSRPEHVEENLALAAIPPATPEQYRRLFRAAAPGGVD